MFASSSGGSGSSNNADRPQNILNPSSSAFGAGNGSFFGATTSNFGASTQPNTGNASGMSASPFANSNGAFGVGGVTSANQQSASGMFFGSQPAQTPNNQSSFFGGASAAAPNASSGFGTGAFSTPASAASSPFGGQSSGGGAFGSSTPFGVSQPASSGFGGFGGGNAQSSLNAFGSKPLSSSGTFGSGSGFGFSSNNASTATPFGSSATPSNAPFGQASFGFGAATPSSNTATSTSSMFGGSAGGTGNTGLFGGSSAATQPSTGGLFGASTASQQFGATPSFTGTLGGFGSASTPSASLGFAAPGTGNPPFSATSDTEVDKTVYLQAISAMPAYKNKSFEELRLEDYAKGNRFGGFATPAATSGFGTMFGAGSSAFSAAKSAMGSGNAFGSTPFQSSMTNNAPAASAFGTQPQTPFGARPGFSSQSQPQPSSTSGGFFGGGAFGAPSTGAFGATPAPSAFGSSQSGAFGGQSTLGMTNPSSSSGGGGMFGQMPPSTQSMFGGAPGSQPASQQSGFFGSAGQNTAAFGSSFQTPAAPSNTPFGGGAGNFGSFSAFGGAQSNASAPQSSVGSNSASMPSFGGGAASSSQAPSGSSGLFSFGKPGGNAATLPSFGGYSAAQTPAAPTSSFSFGAPSSTPTAPSMFGAASSSTAMPGSSFSFKPTFGSTAPSAATPSTPYGSATAFGAIPTATPMKTPVSTTTNAALASTENAPSKCTTLAFAEKPAQMPPIATPSRLYLPKSFLRFNQLDDGAASAKGADRPPSAIAPSSFLWEILAANASRRTHVKKLVLEFATASDAPEAFVHEVSEQEAAAPNPPKAIAALPETTAAYGAESADRDAQDAEGAVPDGHYFASPPVSVLKRMSQDALSAVKYFRVGRKGIGEVEFLEPVDLRHTPLDDIYAKIVAFTPKQITVYADEATKPPVGEALNVPAKVTLFGCWPLDAQTKRPVTSAIGEGVLRAHTRKLALVADTEFIDFRVASGAWIFRVNHFSTYAAADDDDNKDNNEGCISMAAAAATLEKSALETSAAASNADKQPLLQWSAKFPRAALSDAGLFWASSSRACLLPNGSLLTAAGRRVAHRPIQVPCVLDEGRIALLQTLLTGQSSAELAASVRQTLNPTLFDVWMLMTKATESAALLSSGESAWEFRQRLCDLLVSHESVSADAPPAALVMAGVANELGRRLCDAKRFRIATVAALMPLPAAKRALLRRAFSEDDAAADNRSRPSNSDARLLAMLAGEVAACDAEDRLQRLVFCVRTQPERALIDAWKQATQATAKENGAKTLQSAQLAAIVALFVAPLCADSCVRPQLPAENVGDVWRDEELLILALFDGGAAVGRLLSRAAVAIAAHNVAVALLHIAAAASSEASSAGRTARHTAKALWQSAAGGGRLPACFWRVAATPHLALNVTQPAPNDAAWHAHCACIAVADRDDWTVVRHALLAHNIAWAAAVFVHRLFPLAAQRIASSSSCDAFVVEWAKFVRLHVAPAAAALPDARHALGLCDFLLAKAQPATAPQNADVGLLAWHCVTVCDAVLAARHSVFGGRLGERVAWLAVLQDCASTTHASFWAQYAVAVQRGTLCDATVCAVLRVAATNRLAVETPSSSRSEFFLEERLLF